MGTRHLTIVRADKQLKVAQYGQWDGYPRGQGKNVLAFLRKMNPDTFRQQLKKVRWITEKEFDALKVAAGIDPKAEFIDYDVAQKFGAMHPEIHRDTGSKILQLIYKHKGKELLLENAHSFLTSQGGFGCEWAYEIDLDKNVLHVYRGGSQPFKSYPLDKLPTLTQMRKDCDYRDDD